MIRLFAIVLFEITPRCKYIFSRACRHQRKPNSPIPSHTHLHPALLHFITFLFLLAPCRIVLSATRSIAMHASSTASHLPNKNTDTIFGLGDDKETDRTPSNVHGWLMNVHGYREPSEPYDNNMRYLISGCRGVNARCT